MSTVTVLVILLSLCAVALIGGTTLLRRRDRSLAEATPPIDASDNEATGVSRRQVLNRGLLSFGAIASGGLSGSILAFLWPNPAGGFGSRIRVGALADVVSTLESQRAPLFVAEARAYLAPYPSGALAEGLATYDDRLHAGMEAGLVALFQTCPHLGCRVPWCQSSQWFECPCHKSKYNRVGEKRDGPAPRGLDRFPVVLDGGAVVIDTGELIVGPPVGTDTTGQQAEGPHCVGA